MSAERVVNMHPPALSRAELLGLHIISFPRGRKGPIENEWQSKPRETVADMLRGANRENLNWGAVTGAQLASGRYLADVDIDWAPGARAADLLLPRTTARFGRRSKRPSHLLYATEKPLPSTEYKDPIPPPGEKAMLLELRSAKKDGKLGKQTMIPPSVHPDTGEVLSWESDEWEPAEGDSGLLREHVRHTAAAMLIGRHWPGSSRHALRLAYARVLLETLGLDSGAAAAILRAACEAGGCDRAGIDDAEQAVADTSAKLNARQPATGGKTVAEILPDKGAKIVAQLREWYGKEKTASAPILSRAADFLASAGEQEEWLVPGIAPVGGLVMFHGRPRSMKSLAALAMLVGVSLGRAPWGVAKFHPAKPVRAAYFSEEDGRGLVAARLKWLLAGLGAEPPEHLLIECRRGLLLSDPRSQEAMRGAIQEHGVELAWFDTARAMAPGVDQGPAEAAPAVKFLRELLSDTGLRSVGLTHHDVKPNREGTDVRSRAERASGGALLAAVDCPVGFERLGERSTLVVPDRYKVGADPHPLRLTFDSATPEGDSFREFVRVSAVDSDEKAEAACRVRDEVLRVLTDAADWVNTKHIREAVTARGNDVVSALARLHDSGDVEKRDAARGAKEYRVVARQTEIEL